jgi:hypothetical protein
MVRGIMMMLEDAQNIMKVDDMSDVIRSIGKVLIELEDTWAMIALCKTEELARRTGQSPPERSGHDPEGAS